MIEDQNRWLRGCGVTILKETQNLTGHSTEQPTLVDSTLSRVFGLGNLQKSFPISTMLWFCDSISDKVWSYLWRNLTQYLISTYISFLETNDFCILAFLYFIILLDILYWLTVSCWIKTHKPSILNVYQERRKYFKSLNMRLFLFMRMNSILHTLFLQITSW